MLRSAVNYEDNFESCVCVLHITSFRLREFLPCKPICSKPTPSTRARATSPSCPPSSPRFTLLPYPTADRSLSAGQIRTKSPDRFLECFLMRTRAAVRPGWRLHALANIIHPAIVWYRYIRFSVRSAAFNHSPVPLILNQINVFRGIRVNGVASLRIARWEIEWRMEMRR